MLSRYWHAHGPAKKEVAALNQIYVARTLERYEFDPEGIERASSSALAIVLPSGVVKRGGVPLSSAASVIGVCTSHNTSARHGATLVHGTTEDTRPRPTKSMDRDRTNTIAEATSMQSAAMPLTLVCTSPLATRITMLFEHRRTAAHAGVGTLLAQRVPPRRRKPANQ